MRKWRQEETEPVIKFNKINVPHSRIHIQKHKYIHVHTHVTLLFVYQAFLLKSPNHLHFFFSFYICGSHCISLPHLL